MKCRPLRQRHQAFALIFVLISILFAATIAIFFLANTAQERKAADLYAESVAVRHLSTMAVHRVIGQINTATRENTATEPVLWASQPGLIRTFGTNGTVRNVYKLYSWDTLVDAGSSFDFTASALAPPANWAQNPGLYTDLNQPVAQTYPILDPAAEGAVDGFSIDANHAAVAGGSGNPAPMPVRWLYILEDGQMVAPTAGLTIPGASAANPIIGRVAYWTDDETAKVNLNTASEGAFWDWPKAATPDEMQFAGNPPLAGEFYRTPGHPAMTSLSAVFPMLAPPERWAGGDPQPFRDALGTLLELSPRGAPLAGGSLGGTYPVESLNATYGPTPATPIPNAPLAHRSDRLLTSPDELYFHPTSRAAQAGLSVDLLTQRRFFLTTQSRSPETTAFDTPRISLWPVTWSHASTHAVRPNRQTAPVVALTPDASPLSSNPWMRPEERLLAFASSLNRQEATGGDRYFFQRQDPESATHDYTAISRNQALLAYLQRLTSQSVPGYTGSLAGTMGTTARDFLLLNALDATRSLVNLATVQPDGSLLYAYAPVAFSEWRRADLSLGSLYREPGAFYVTPLRADLGSGEQRAIGQLPTLREAALLFYPTARRAPVAPATPGQYHQAEHWNHLIKTAGGPVSNPADTRPPGAQTTRLHAVMLLDFHLLDGSYGDARPRFWVRVSQASGFSLDGGAGTIPINFDGATALFEAEHDLAVPPYLRPLYDATGQPKTFLHGTVDAGNYGLAIPFPSADNVSPDAVDFSFTGGPLVIDLFEATATPPAATALPIASYRVDLSGWNGTRPMPILPWWSYTNPLAAGQPAPHFPLGSWAAVEIAPAREGQSLPTASGLSTANLIDFRQRLAFLKDQPEAALRMGSYPAITPFDTVFSVLPDPTHSSGGDPRLTPHAGTPFARIDTVLGAANLPAEVVSRTDYPRLPTQHHALGGGGVTGYRRADLFHLFQSTAALAIRGAQNAGGVLGADEPTPDGTEAIGAISDRPLHTISPGQSVGDWSSRPGPLADGGALPLADQRFQTLNSGHPAPGFTYQTPYFEIGGFKYSTLAAQGSFSPHRQLPSPIALLGSLPASQTTGWQTLAFSPNPAAGAAHPGLNPNAPHSLWLDLFWMPVVEPYAISEAFATDGKINLNTRIFPFSYLRRDTGWHALLKSTWLTAMTSTPAMIENYKSHDGVRQHVSNAQTRYRIDATETLARLDTTTFANGGIFRTASELSTVWLVPEGHTAGNVTSFWDDKQLTSDTAREAPYDHLYSRTTTRSNTYTIHWRVQTLRKVPSTGASIWIEGRDQVSAELRGSTTIERYLDPDTTPLPDYATTTQPQPLSHFYRWRVLSEDYFQP